MSIRAVQYGRLTGMCSLAVTDPESGASDDRGGLMTLRVCYPPRVAKTATVLKKPATRKTRNPSLPVFQLKITLEDIEPTI